MPAKSPINEKYAGPDWVRCTCGSKNLRHKTVAKTKVTCGRCLGTSYVSDLIRISEQRKVEYREPVSYDEICKRKAAETGIKGRKYVAGVRKPISVGEYDLRSNMNLAMLARR